MHITASTALARWAKAIRLFLTSSFTGAATAKEAGDKHFFCNAGIPHRDQLLATSWSGSIFLALTKRSACDLGVVLAVLVVRASFPSGVLAWVFGPGAVVLLPL